VKLAGIFYLLRSWQTYWIRETVFDFGCHKKGP
jgi:hypothetical protein